MTTTAEITTAEIAADAGADERTGIGPTPSPRPGRRVRTLLVALAMSVALSAGIATTSPQAAEASTGSGAYVYCNSQFRSIHTAPYGVHVNYYGVILYRWNGSSWQYHDVRAGMLLDQFRNLRSGYYAVTVWYSTFGQQWYHVPGPYRYESQRTFADPSPSVRTDYCWIS